MENNQDIDIKNKIMAEIDKDKICPTPKWCFACKNYFVWTLLGTLIILTSIIFSILVFLFISHDWDVYKYVSSNLVQHILFYTPYFWIIFFFVFILFANYVFYKTKEGYKCELKKTRLFGFTIILVIMLISLFLGMARLVHETIFENIPQYDYVIHDKNNIWDNHDNGLLSGQIIEIIDPKTFYLEDFKNKLWQVKEQKDIKMPRNFIIEKGIKIKIIGKEFPGNIFIANTIKPWKTKLGF